MLDCRSRIWGVQIPDRVEFCLILHSTFAPSQLNYNECNGRALTVGKRDGKGEDWEPTSYAMTEKIKSEVLYPLHIRALIFGGIPKHDMRIPWCFGSKTFCLSLFFAQFLNC